MSRLAGKFIVGIGLIFISIGLLYLFLNAHFVRRYFLYTEKKELNRICDELIKGNESLKERTRRLEEEEDVVIVQVDNSEDNEIINERIRKAFLEQGIGLSQYWLWDQDQQDIRKEGRKMKLYSQKKLHYSLLIEYLFLNGQFLAVAKILPSMERTISLVSRVTGAVYMSAAFLMFLLVLLLVRKILIPLREIGMTANSIAGLDFKRAEVHTKDELEDLAGVINDMSRKLQIAHQAQEQRNQQMEDLLANVAHDLKTPVSLIKAYASGMKDGMDDGTFLDTIMLQSNRMDEILQKLLDLSRLQGQEAQKEYFDIGAYLTRMVDNFRMQAQERRLIFLCDIREAAGIRTEPEPVRMILENLLSNSVKYALPGEITLLLKRTEEGMLFRIGNRVDEKEEFHTDKLWEPFYVGETSRNKELSGTGLGLSIVKNAAERCHFAYGCKIQNGIITFTIVFRETPDEP